MVDTSGIGTLNGGGSDMFAATAKTPDVQKAEFLQLLITQLRHQDPMEPQDSQQFAAQLAQFTSLEQLQNISGTLQQGVEADLVLTQTINNTMAATMIGKQVHAAGNTLSIERGQSADLHFQLGAYADNVEISIKDAAGQTVRTMSMQSAVSGDHSLEWDGLNSNGDPALPGSYTFTVSASNAAGESIAATPMIFGIIEGVRYGNSGAIFVVNGKEIPFSSVLELGMGQEGGG